jgi:chromosome segregation ATPase
MGHAAELASEAILKLVEELRNSRVAQAHRDEGTHHLLSEINRHLGNIERGQEEIRGVMENLNMRASNSERKIAVLKEMIETLEGRTDELATRVSTLEGHGSTQTS